MQQEGIPLRAVALRRAPPLPEGFPFTVPAIASLDELAFSSPVTFLVGENGCGKSTLLEAMACAAASVAAGSERLDEDVTLEAVRTLGRRLCATGLAFRQVRARLPARVRDGPSVGKGLG